MPPGRPECRRYSLSCAFLPVTMTFSQLTMITLSPTSAPGVKVGLSLPMRILAHSDAIRPRRRPSASTTYHFLLSAAMSAAFGNHVFCPAVGGSEATPSSMQTCARQLGAARGASGAGPSEYARAATAAASIGREGAATRLRVVTA